MRIILNEEEIKMAIVQYLKLKGQQANSIILHVDEKKVFTSSNAFYDFFDRIKTFTAIIE